MRKAKKPFRATVLEMLEVQKGPDSPGRTTQQEGTKQKHFQPEHLSALKESFLLCIKLTSYNANVCCREKAERITRFQKGSLP